MDSPAVEASVFTIPWLDLLGYEDLSDPQKVELIDAARNAVEVYVGERLTRYLPVQVVRELYDSLRSPVGVR